MEALVGVREEVESLVQVAVEAVLFHEVFIMRLICLQP